MGNGLSLFVLLVRFGEVYIFSQFFNSRPNHSKRGHQQLHKNPVVKSELVFYFYNRKFKFPIILL